MSTMAAGTAYFLQLLNFICIQAEAGTLSQATLEDGFRLETKTSWSKP